MSFIKDLVAWRRRAGEAADTVADEDYWDDEEDFDDEFDEIEADDATLAPLAEVAAASRSAGVRAAEPAAAPRPAMTRPVDPAETADILARVAQAGAARAAKAEEEKAAPPASATAAAPATGSAKIWDLQSAAPRAPAATVSPAAPIATAAPAPVADAGPETRSGGRVKTRLLGFHAAAGPDVFDAAPAAPVPGRTMFPTGWIVVTSGPGRGAAFTLGTGVSQIGRGEDQAVRLDFGDMTISRRNHAAVAYDDEVGQFFLGHGGKSNLVRLNGRPVLSTEPLADRDEIRIGETTLQFVAFCDERFSWTEEPGHGVAEG